MTKVAIVGAGFAGLSTAYHLKKHFNLSVDLYSKIGPLGGASAIATGLLHPFIGPFAKLADQGKEAFQEAVLQVGDLEKVSNQKLCRQDGIFRPALYPRQARSFKKQARLHEEIDWIDAPHPFCNQAGILIKNGVTVFSKLYLESLWNQCIALGISTYIKEINHEEELSDYDVIVWACGAESLDLPNLSDLPFEKVKGQVLRMEWPRKKELPPWGIIARKYLVMEESRNSCLIGSTYESDFIDDAPDPKLALEKILPATSSIHPDIANFKFLECKSGIRVHGPDKRNPFIKRLNEQSWIFSGLGSRGLLYHAYYAKKLAQEIHDESLKSAPFKDKE